MQHTRVDIKCQRNRVTLPVTLGQYEGNSGVLILWNLLIIGVTSVSTDFGYLPLFPKFTIPIIRIDKRWRNHRSLAPGPTLAVSLWV
jgi:hypothetical protein